MKKSILSIFVLSIIASSTYAASVHLKGGKRAEPTATDSGLVLLITGALSGLGNGDVLITLDVLGNPLASCINPGSGEHRPPGQNPAELALTGVTSIPEEEIKNGNTPFSVATIPPVTPIPGAPDCPNPRWREVIEDIAFTAATITVEQPEGFTVLTVSCTIDPPSSDGKIDRGDVSCTSTRF